MKKLESNKKSKKKKQITEFDGLKATTTLGKFSGKKRKRGMTIDYNTLEEFLEKEQKTKKKDVKKNLDSNQQFQIQGK